MFPKIENLLVQNDASIRDAIKTIDDNAQGICFLVDSEGKLTGVFTDGDARRAFLAGATLDDRPLEKFCRKDFVKLPIETPSEEIDAYLDAAIRHIPLIDASDRPVDYACRRRSKHLPVATPSLRGNELEYVIDCVKSNWISSQGSYVRKFEQYFTDLFSGRPAIAVSNGTVALHLALDALGIGPGDEVLVPNFTFAAPLNAVIYTGATPVLVDINPSTWTIDPSAAKRAITSRTKAIIPVHIYGQACEMDEIMNLASRHSLKVVEDCAEALGTEYCGRLVGSFGDAATFSFFGNKTITTGEGGMVIFANKADHEKAAVLRDHGMSKQKRYWHEHVGYNYRLTNLQAAIGVAQMERFNELLSAKFRLGALYRKGLSGIRGIILPREFPWCRNSYWLFTIMVGNDCAVSRDDLITKLALNGIESRPVFYPLHQMPPYREYVGNQKFPVTEEISSTGVSLPSSSDLTAEDINEICEAIRRVCETKSYS